MIVFLTLCYCAVLFLLVKVGVIKLNAFWKISPLLWLLLLFTVLFIPMQWGAPSGAVRMYEFVVEIIPNVNGEVIEVPARPLVPMKKGDVLFKIDPRTFRAAVDDLEARLALARTRLEQSRDLLRRRAGSAYDVEQYQADVDSLEAQLEAARWDLEKTVVVAPADGYVSGLTLQPGQRVSRLAVRSWVSFVVPTQTLVAGIPQNRLRHVEPGQAAEVVFKFFPGKVFPATVEAIVPMTPEGQLAPSGTVPTPPLPGDGAAPYGVILKLDPAGVPLGDVPGGAAGTAAIYTRSVQLSHVIRKVMVRMEAWLNYVVP